MKKEPIEMILFHGCRLPHKQKELVESSTPHRPTELVLLNKNVGDTFLLLSEGRAGTILHAASPRFGTDSFCSQCNQSTK